MGRKEVFKEEIIEIGGGERLWILMVFFQVYIPPPGFREDNMLLVIKPLDNLFFYIFFINKVKQVTCQEGDRFEVITPQKNRIIA